MTTGRALRLVPVLIGLGAAVSGCRESPPPPAPPEAVEGVSRSLAELRKGTVSDPRYEVRFSIPRERSSPVRGRLEVRFTWDDPDERPVILDFREPERRLLEVRVNGLDVRPWTAAKTCGGKSA